MSTRPTGSPARGVDFFDLNAELSEEEQLIRDTVRAFINDKALPIIDKAFMDDRFPTELIPEMAADGPARRDLTGYGLRGLEHVAYGLIMQELERGDSGLRSFASVQGGARDVSDPRASAPTRRRSSWLPALAAGAAIGCFGLTEPDHGSDPAAMRHARRAAGRRAGCSTAPSAGSRTARSPTSPSSGPRREDGIRGFLVEKGTPGFHDASTSRASSRCARRSPRSSSSQDVRAPRRTRCCRAPSGLKAPLSA